MSLKRTDKNIPLVCVCVATYNQENYIAETIESIIDQDIDGLRLLIGDDCSTDDTVNIVKSYQAQYPDIIELIEQNENLGIAGNVEAIYAGITGKYVCWFAGDDLFLPGKLEAQLACMETNPDCVLCYHDVWVTQKATGKRYRYNAPFIGQKAYHKNITQRLITERCFIPGISMMIRRFGTEDIAHSRDVGHCNDWLYILELSMCGKILCIDEPLAIYFRHEGNITKRSIDFRHEEKIYDYLDKNYRDQYADEIIKGRLSLYLSFYLKYLISGNSEQAAIVRKKFTTILRKNSRFIPYVIYRSAVFTIRRLILMSFSGSVFR